MLKNIFALKYNASFDTVVSIDEQGMIEYWRASDCTFPKSEVSFQFKSETDLYEFAKKKTAPVSLTFSTDGTLFATMGKDRQVS